MRIFILFIALSVCAATLHAQNSISGIVTGFKDSAVADVSVLVLESGKYDATKAGGTFILRNVPKGVLHIQFSKPGFTTVVNTISMHDSAMVMNVNLKPSLGEADYILASSGNSKLPSGVPFQAGTFTLREYRRTGAVTLMHALALQPGVDKISLGNGINRPVIRGMSFNRLQIREFGTRILQQPWDYRSDIGLTELGVTRVEVLKGPAALAYGSDALGGVLVYADEDPAAAGTLQGEVGIGIHSNPRGLEGEIGVKGAAKSGLFYSIRGGVISHTSYIQGEDLDEVKKNTEAKAFALNSKWGNESGKVVLGLSKKWGMSKLTWSYHHQSSGLIRAPEENPNMSPSEETDQQREREYQAPYRESARNLIALENVLMTGKSKVNVNIAWQQDRQDFFISDPFSTDGSEIQELEIFDASAFTFDAKWTSNPEKKFGFSFGAQGLLQQNNFSVLLPESITGSSTTEFGGYAMLRYDGGKINLSGGARFDSKQVDFDQEPVLIYPGIESQRYTPVSYMAGLAYHPVGMLTIKLNAGSGYTVPDHIQLDTYSYDDERLLKILGNRSLGLEQNMQGDLGILFAAPSVDVEVSGFYNLVTDYIFMQPTGLQDTISDSVQTIYDVYGFDQEDAVLTGGEAMIDIHPAALKWVGFRIGYSTLKGELDGGGQVPYIPADKLTGELTFRTKKLKWFYNPYLTLALSSHAAQEDTASFERASEAYSLFDVRIGLQLPFAHQVVDVHLAVTNLLNTPYMSYLSQVRALGIRDMGRNVSIKVRIPFGLKGFSR